MNRSYLTRFFYKILIYNDNLPFEELIFDMYNKKYINNLKEKCLCQCGYNDINFRNNTMIKDLIRSQDGVYSYDMFICRKCGKVRNGPVHINDDYDVDQNIIYVDISNHQEYSYMSFSLGVPYFITTPSKVNRVIIEQKTIFEILRFYMCYIDVEYSNCITYKDLSNTILLGIFDTYSKLITAGRIAKKVQFVNYILYEIENDNMFDLKLKNLNISE